MTISEGQRERESLRHGLHNNKLLLGRTQLVLLELHGRQWMQWEEWPGKAEHLKYGWKVVCCLALESRILKRLKSPTLTSLIWKTGTLLYPHKDISVQWDHVEASIAMLKFPLSIYLHLYSLSADVSFISLSPLTSNCSFFSESLSSTLNLPLKKLPISQILSYVCDFPHEGQGKILLIISLCSPTPMPGWSINSEFVLKTFLCQLQLNWAKTISSADASTPSAAWLIF